MGLPGNILNLDQEAVDFIQFFKNNGVREGDSYHLQDDNLIGEVQQNYESLVQELAELEILALDSENQRKRFSNSPPAPKNTEKMPVKTLVLHLVNECNLRCTYCYADGGEYGAPKKYMSEATAKQAVDYLLEHSYQEDSVTIVLFGGEPFINWKVLKYVVEYSAEEGKKKGNKLTIP
ncbi:4Fe-4S cluster-binding domain-containing protein [Bacillus sp. T3]|uniref:4Fe-4S cluster-binding domain-containing protein n=1 Tax=Bacillus sp. T3 TaxID=467262 RepID=UPI002981765E|nr:radical SAM protein [Bacillus sp. T3]